MKFVFINKKTQKPVCAGIAKLAKGCDWEIYIIRKGEPRKFHTFAGADGFRVDLMIQMLSEETGLSALAYESVYLLEVPEAVTCLGCGRRLVNGYCPELLATGKKSHRKAR